MLCMYVCRGNGQCLPEDIARFVPYGADEVVLDKPHVNDRVGNNMCIYIVANKRCQISILIVKDTAWV